MEVGQHVQHRTAPDSLEEFIITKVSPYVAMVELNHEGWSWIDNLVAVEEPEIPKDVQEHLDFLTI